MGIYIIPRQKNLFLLILSASFLLFFAYVRYEFHLRFTKEVFFFFLTKKMRKHAKKFSLRETGFRVALKIVYHLIFFAKTILFSNPNGVVFKSFYTLFFFSCFLTK